MWVGRGFISFQNFMCQYNDNLRFKAYGCILKGKLELNLKKSNQIDTVQ